MDASASQLFTEGAEKFVEDDIEGAFQCFSDAYAVSEDVLEKAKLQASMGMCLLRTGRPQDALQAANGCLEDCQSSFLAHYVKGQALFHLHEFDAAKLSFTKSLSQLSTDDPRCESIQCWVRKCEAELSGSFLPLKGLVKVVNDRQPFKLEEKKETKEDVTERKKDVPHPVQEPEAHSRTVSPPTATSVVQIKPPKTKWDWVQCESSLTVTIRAKNRTLEDVKAQFLKSYLSCSVKLSESDDFVLDLDLWGHVRPADCRVEVSPYKVELILAKDNQIHWIDIERKELPVPLEPVATYPSSYTKKKNWNDVDKLMDAELEGEEKGDPNSLFKQIYSNADPETRRAMVKSYQTSGGTVLSTNWGEVSKADYEGKDKMDPPEGQEWRKW